jgi:hypothetical protein
MASGNGANGATHESPPSALLAMDAPTKTGHNAEISADRLQHIRELLTEPFDPREIKWRVTATAVHRGKHGPQKRGQLVAYADQRAYTDRLNDVFGEWGWTRRYDVQVAQNFERRSTRDKKQTAVAAKVVVVSTVTVHGLGSHTGIGEEWADDQNAATRAEAQAFKRACACFGLGRYLYDLDTVWVDLDQYDRPTRTPALPEWALPSHSRHGNAHVQRGEMLATIHVLRKKVGRGLSAFVLEKYAGGTEPETVDETTVKTILQKLTDLANGIDRLRRAAARVGKDQYSTLCRELNLSESIDEIPDRTTLQRLLIRAEADAGTNKPFVV